MAESKESKYHSARVIGLLGTIPLILAVSPLIGYGIGHYLDKWLHTAWVLRCLFTILGFGAGVKEMMRLLKRARKDFEKI